MGDTASLIVVVTGGFPVEGLPMRVIRFMDSDEPGDIVTDFTGWDSDYASTYRVFKGKRWDQITLDSFEQAGFAGSPFDMYNFLTDEAFRYYLPAWLVTAVKAQETQPDILEQLCTNANPYRFMPDKIEASFVQHYETLVFDQKSVVARIIKWACSNLPQHMQAAAIDAYRNYWHQFDSDPFRKA